MIVRKSADKYYYICSGKVNKIENKCNCKNVRVDELDNIIVSTLSTYSKDFLIKELPNVIKQNSNEAVSNNTTNIEKELKDKKDIVSSLTKRVAFAPSDDVAQVLMSEIAECNKEIRNLEDKLQEIADAHTKKKIDKHNISLFIDSLKNFSKNIRSFDDVVKRRSLVQSIVRRITWDGENFEANIELLEDISPEMKKK